MNSYNCYVYGHCRLLLPWLRVPCWFFWNLLLKNCSQSSVFDLSFKTTPENVRKDLKLNFLWPKLINLKKFSFSLKFESLMKKLELFIFRIVFNKLFHWNQVIFAPDDIVYKFIRCLRNSWRRGVKFFLFLLRAMLANMKNIFFDGKNFLWITVSTILFLIPSFIFSISFHSSVSFPSFPGLASIQEKEGYDES